VDKNRHRRLAAGGPGAAASGNDASAAEGGNFGDRCFAPLHCRRLRQEEGPQDLRHGRRAPAPESPGVTKAVSMAIPSSPVTKAPDDRSMLGAAHPGRPAASTPAPARERGAVAPPRPSRERTRTLTCQSLHASQDCAPLLTYVEPWHLHLTLEDDGGRRDVSPAFCTLSAPVRPWPPLPSCRRNEDRPATFGWPSRAGQARCTPNGR